MLISNSRSSLPIVKNTAIKMADALAVPVSDPQMPPAVKKNPWKTFKKLFPLGAMLFFILFNYTILRDTKDVLVVTAPNSGAEIIPFLKTYVNLPAAVGFTLLYSSLCNRFSTEKVFYIVMSSFLTFFGAFAGIICKFLLSYISITPHI
jgi:ATP/ADP translocase